MRLIRSFYPALLFIAVLALLCTQVRVRGDDFADHLAQLRAKNAAPKSGIRPHVCHCDGPETCDCGPDCACRNCPDWSAANPGRRDGERRHATDGGPDWVWDAQAKMWWRPIVGAAVRPAKPAGDGWQWTSEDGGYWFRWKAAPAGTAYAPIAPQAYYQPARLAPVSFGGFAGVCRGGG